MADRTGGGTAMDWAELRRLAGEATPGLWHDVPHGWPEKAVPVLTHDAAHTVAMAFARDGQAFADAAYIASASPDRILALLDRLDALQTLAIQTHFHTRPSVDFPRGRQGDPACATCQMLGVPLGYGSL